ncbi:MAG: hypothetical protein K6E59_00400, partial [Bacilli bacterium]|nr:hypothetical protein [Bacilli bacterium]
TTDISDSDVNKAYAIQASRKGAAVLYFARPGNSDMGQIGVRDYKSTLISAANQFHNDFIDASENISSDSGCFVNVRKDGNKAGAMIINVNASNNPTVRVELPNGTYTDILSNREFTVSNNQVQASFTSDALMLENFKGGQPSSSVTITPKDYVFKDKTTVTFTCSEAATYQIGSASPVSFQGTKNVEIGAGLSEGEIIVKATCNGKTQQVTLTKTALAEKSFIIYNVPTDDNLLLWGWDKASDSTWIDLTRYKGVLAVDLAKKQYIVVKFPKGVTSQNADWGNKIAQTDDLHNDGVIRLDYSSIAFK